MPPTPPRAVVCDLRGCDKPLAEGQRKYCSKTHQNTAAKRRARAKKAGLVTKDAEPKTSATEGRTETTADGRVSARKPPPLFVDDGWYDAIDDGYMTHQQVSEQLETTPANVSRWFEYVRRQREIERAADGWERPPEAVRALTDFQFFRERYFVAARGAFRGKPYVTEPFHLKWINAVLDALPEEAGGNGDVGGQQLILSPPRHGKTELLAHFCIWLILRNPDIVIIWIAKAERQAKEVGSVIRDNLERNEALVAEMLGPGGTFKSERGSGAAWRDDEFEVATRTVPQKAPTFRSIGRGGNLQSVDADFIVTDDIEDHDSTRTPHQRQATLDWLLTEVESRKEPHTAWLCIGSRNHPHDVLDHLLKSEDWQAIVETAHSPDCEQPIADPDRHVDCMLWPKKFPYSELAKKIRNSGEATISMRYLNDPQGDGIVVFTEAALRGCLDRSRVLGLPALPPGYELLGSIDPSPGVHQVAQVWGWSRENPVRYLIDIHAGKGGMDAWEDLVRKWLEKYELRRWVVEDNSSQTDYINRREFLQWRQDNGVHVTGHTTGKNKHSIGIGVGSMHPLYVNSHIVLPYGDPETQGKVDAFIREHVGYDPDRTQRDRNWRIDRVVCAWFANTLIDTLCGGRIQSETQDNMPSWMEPAGLGWVDDDQVGGWLT